MSSLYRGLIAPDYADSADVPFALREFIDSGPIPRFPNEATRNASITSPVKGTVAYIELLNKFTYYNGSAWVDMVPPLPTTWPSNQIAWVTGSVPATAVAFPSASITVKGIVQLTESLTSTSTTLAPTANAMSKAVNKTTTALQTMVGPLRVPGGSQTSPALQFLGPHGFYHTTGATGETLRVALDSVAVWEFNNLNDGGFGQIAFQTGTGFTENPTIGMMRHEGGFYTAVRLNGPAAFLGRNSTGVVVDFRRFGEAVGSISVAPGGTSYNTTSDETLKEHIKDVDRESMLSIILGLRTRDFRWKATKEETIGMISQEVEKVYPQAVTRPEPSDVAPSYWQLDYSKFVPILVAAVQELAARLDALTPQEET